ncbi:ATP-binding protein [Phenylobacterium sp.]|uniref:ATP-binding protein n=1 Tax=Phenylobacterium sp. TaxID=1871053 RepID=UPI002FC6F33D
MLAIAALVPSLLLAVAGGYFALSAQRSELQNKAVANAQILSRSIDREIESQLDQAEALAASPALDSPADLALFSEIARRERRRHPLWVAVILLDPSGEWIAHTEMDPTGRRAVDSASLDKVLRSHSPAVGEMARGARGTWGMPVRAPVIRDGKLTSVATIVSRPDNFHGLIAALQSPPGWIITVVNQNGQVVARSRSQAEFVGRPASPAALRSRARAAVGGTYEGRTLENTPTMSAYWRSPATGWSVHIGVPRAAFDAPLRRTFQLMAAGLGLGLGLTMLFVWLLLRDLAARSAQAAVVEQATRMDALGRLTGGVAHDFNNLLMIIQGNVDTLTRRLADHEGAQRPLSAMRTATERATRLTRQLLSFARGGPSDARVVDLSQAVKATTMAMQQLLGPSVILTLRLGQGPLPVEIDELQLEAALLNLCANARDAMPDGGRVEISTRAAGADIELEVRDTGPGFARNIAPRVFEPFFTTKAHGKGTGLGLTQVYGFANALGGRVAVSNAAGGGGVVTLRLPRAQAAPVEAQDVAVPDPDENPQARVLVVEDDEEVRATTGAYLRESGLTVREARDAAEALEVLQQEPFDAVVSDIVMPGSMDGAALARVILRRWPSLPVLLVSGYSDTAAEAQRQGIAVVPKPYDLSALERAVRSMAAGRSPQEAYVTRG